MGKLKTIPRSRSMVDSRTALYQAGGQRGGPVIECDIVEPEMMLKVDSNRRRKVPRALTPTTLDSSRVVLAPSQTQAKANSGSVSRTPKLEGNTVRDQAVLHDRRLLCFHLVLHSAYISHWMLWPPSSECRPLVCSGWSLARVAQRISLEIPSVISGPSQGGTANDIRVKRQKTTLILNASHTLLYPQPTRGSQERSPSRAGKVAAHHPMSKKYHPSTRRPVGRKTQFPSSLRWYPRGDPSTVQCL